MNLKPIVKYNINRLIKTIETFYKIIITMCIFIIIINKITGGEVTSSGIEAASVIFIFIIGLSFFKENFYFMKSNNITRKDFLYGMAIAIIPITIIMSIIDLLINRIYNIFISSPSMYDMIYTAIESNSNFIQDNSLYALISTMVFQVSLYLLAFSLGFLICILYYKSNKFMKILLSISPMLIIMIIGNIGFYYNEAFMNLMSFLGVILGLESNNSNFASLTFIILYIILMQLIRLLIKKIEIKQG